VPPAPSAPRAPASSGTGTAPRFASLDDLHAAVFGSGQLRLVNHWATWCSGCVDELPLLVALHEDVGSEVEFLGVSWEGFDGGLLGQDLLDEVQAASTIHGLRWQSLLIEAPPPEFFDRFELDCQTIPQVWLVDGEGTVLHRIEQALEPTDVDDLKHRIAAALKPSGK
jgi:thiol-disulfide isomerase/thioredoxin